MFPEVTCKHMEENMAYGKIRLGILIILLVFGMIGCEVSLTGTLDGTVWVGGGKELEFTTGSNFSYDHGANIGTYTLSMNKEKITFNQTFPSKVSYSGSYYADYRITVDYFTGSSVNFTPKP